MIERVILPLMVLGFIGLALLAFIFLAASKRYRRNTGLPAGKVVYKDASGMAKAPFFSVKYGLKGKPDYLLQDRRGNFIPVEIKSRELPSSGQPYDSHVMQLGAYFLLIEDVLNVEAPYGMIRYRDYNVEVDNTEELLEETLDIVDQMRAALIDGNAHRSHNHPQRCAKCSMAHICDERLELPEE